MVRFHSFYPWHTGGDYRHLCNNKDNEMLAWICEFNKFDLYSKSDDLPDIAALKPYYQSLIDKYLPGTLKW
ncbi:inositol oxygenase-like [Saccoglossus kowalevskii]